MRRRDLPPADRATDVGQRAVNGILWLGLSSGGHAVLRIGLIAVLARLIAPADFGLVSAAMVVVELTAIFAEAGIGTALVQRAEIDDRHIRTGFTFQIVAAVAIWSLLAAGADVIAGLFRMPDLARIIPVLTLVLVIRSLTLGQFLLDRDLRFRTAAIIDLVSWPLGNAAVAVTLALRGFGLWAIVAGALGQEVLRTVLLWIHAPHPVRPLWDRRILRELLAFGGGYTAGWWANFVARQGDNVVVGRWLGADALGLYTRAYGLMRQPAFLFGTIVNRALFPALAAVQDDAARLRRTFLRGSSLLAALVLPLSGLWILTSTELITVLLGRQWLQLRGAFEVLVIGMLFRTSYKLSDSLSTATGHVYQRAWRQAVYAVLIVGGAAVGSRGGIEGVAWGILVALAANFALMSQLSLRITGASWADFARAHLPGIGLTGAVVVPALVVGEFARSATSSVGIVLAATYLVGSAVGLTVLRLAPRFPAGRELAGSLQRITGMFRPGSRPRRTLTFVLGAAYGPPLPRDIETAP